jgi:hypothetical protein
MVCNNKCTIIHACPLNAHHQNLYLCLLVAEIINIKHLPSQSENHCFHRKPKFVEDYITFHFSQPPCSSTRLLRNSLILLGSISVIKNLSIRPIILEDSFESQLASESYNQIKKASLSSSSILGFENYLAGSVKR